MKKKTIRLYVFVGRLFAFKALIVFNNVRTIPYAYG